jgi:hypothetical protein
MANMPDSRTENNSGKERPRRSRITRRGMMRTLLAGAGTGLALPVITSNSSAASPGAPGMTMPPASPAKSPSGPWRPAFLDEHQNATLIILGERIAPGSTKAEVNRFIDLLLSVLPADAPQRFATGNSVPQGTVSVPAPARQRLFDALGAFDAEARKRYGKPFKEISETQQLAILNDASKPPAREKEPGANVRHLVPAERPVTLYDHFLDLKNWIVGAYYSSEAGIRELGWTGQVIFASYPGCQSSSGHGA